MRLTRWFALALIVTLGCGRTGGQAPPPPSESERWPALPRAEQEAKGLIRASTVRTEIDVPDGPPDAGVLLERAFGAGWGTVVLGANATRDWVQGFADRAAARGHDATLLYGTFHDSAGQIDAFRRLIGPGGLRGLTAVTLEQFRATGAWQGVPADAQRGDDADLAAYVEQGETAAFDRLARRHRASDYAAWKLGYEPSVLELLVTGRAMFDAGRGPSILGCDMPTDTRELLGGVTLETKEGLRELHCLRATADAARARAHGRAPLQRVAMLWGAAHARTFRRFVPASSEVLTLYVVGFRGGEGTLEATLATELALADPLLVPLNDRADVAVLLYPDDRLGAVVDRVHESEARQGAPPVSRGTSRVVVEASTPAHVVIGGRSLELSTSPDAPSAVATVDVPVGGDHRYSVLAAGVRFAGAAHVAEGAELTLRFDPATRSIDATERGGRR
jgi:hypothetical protein